MRTHRIGPIICRLLAFSFLICASVALSQESLFIAGKVLDSRGSPIPGASVRLLLTDGAPAEVLTSLDGSFRFEPLQMGAYQLIVEIAGFKKATKEAIDVSAESSRNILIQLESLPRPPKPQISSRPQQKQQQTQTQTMNAPSFSNAEVTDLPGLSQFQLAGETDASVSADSRQGNLLFISGNSANLDAGNWNDPGFMGQMMDAARMMGFQIREFGPGGDEGRAGMGGSGPQGEMMGGGPGAGGFGGGPGGGGVGFIGMGGRRGRNSNFKQPWIEGNLSETYGNSALNARNYSLTGQMLDKPVQIQNNFSITVGGTLPFLKSKTTSQRGFMGPPGGGQPGWSFTYGGYRNRSALDVLTTVPTDLERAGDFSQTYIQALTVDPATGQRTVVAQPTKLYLNPYDPSSQFMQIPSIDPIAARLLQFIPKANISCAANAICVNNYALERSLPSASDQIQASITGLRITSKDNFGVNYSMRRGSALNAGIFSGLDSNRDNFDQNIGVSGMHSFHSRLFANWRISLNRTRMKTTNGFSYVNNVEGDLGITGVSQDPINWGPPTISLTGYGNLTLAAPSISRNQTLVISGGLNKIGRKHSIRTGVDINWSQRNTQSDSNGRGTYTFTGYATALVNEQGSQVSGTGNDFADFLLGLPYSTSRRYVDSSVNPYGNSIYLRNRSWNAYVMDNWQARSNFTINYGLRYEYVGPAFEKFDRLVSLDTASNFAELAQVFPNENGRFSGQHFPRSLVNPDRNNFAPRIGIAWRPKSGSPFIFRAGYGIGFNAGGYFSIVNQLVNQPPFAITQNLATERSNPLTLRAGFPANPDLTILNTYAIDPNYKPSYAQQWNLDVQAQISRLYVLNVTYSGAKGTGLDILRAPNRSSSAANFIYQTNGAESIYHGLSIQLARRFSRGFNMRTSYTFSKSIDDSSGSGGSMVAQNDNDLTAERSLSSQDQRHNFQTSFAYELPFGQNRAFFAGASAGALNLISGWTFQGNLTLASGTPLTARYASSNGNASGAALYNSLRPDATGLPVSLPRDERMWSHFFNTAAFAIPAGEYGTAGRNTIVGPGTNMVNLSVRKSFRLDENNRRLDFSWQVQNLLNHPNWSSVSTTINSPNFGQVTSVRGMRSMTMNLRIRF